MAKGSGTGQGGKSFQDRELAARVRTLTLNEIEYVLKNFGYTQGKKKVTKDNKKLYDTILANLSKNILPRLNEHTGEDGGPIAITGVEITVRK